MRSITLEIQTRIRNLRRSQRRGRRVCSEGLGSRRTKTKISLLVKQEIREAPRSLALQLHPQRRRRTHFSEGGLVSNPLLLVRFLEMHLQPLNLRQERLEAVCFGGGLFGNTPAAQNTITTGAPPGSTLFGTNNATTTQPAAGTSLFGGQNQQNTTQTTTSAPSLFGSSNIFGQRPQQSTQPAPSLFGQSQFQTTRSTTTTTTTTTTTNDIRTIYQSTYIWSGHFWGRVHFESTWKLTARSFKFRWLFKPPCSQSCNRAPTFSATPSGYCTRAIHQLVQRIESIEQSVEFKFA